MKSIRKIGTYAHEKLFLPKFYQYAQHSRIQMHLTQYLMYNETKSPSITPKQLSPKGYSYFLQTI